MAGKKNPTKREIFEVLAQHESFRDTLERLPSLTRTELLDILGVPRPRPSSVIKASRSGGGLIEVIVFTDGASRGNPGPAAIGASIQDETGTEIVTVSEEIGHATNNVAEYRAVVAALAAAKRLGAQRVQLRADSELAVKQLNGEYRVKNEQLKPLYDQVKSLEGAFPLGVTYRHVRREQNARADELANNALDAI